MTNIQLHDIVALAEDTQTPRFPCGPEILLNRGQVGTVVEIYKQGEAFEVEFSDDDGQAYAMLTLKANKLIRLHYTPTELAIAG